MAYYDTIKNGSSDRKGEKYTQNDLDFAIIYYDEFNLTNGWHLTAYMEAEVFFFGPNSFDEIRHGYLC